MSITAEQQLSKHLEFIYGEEQAAQLTKRILKILKRFKAEHPDLMASNSKDCVSEQDTILITYGDMVQEEGQLALQTLAAFLKKHLADVVSTVHILPFYPYSSDDGFAVIDYKQVNPVLGSWDDIFQLRNDFRLMFDAVINHISSQSAWFQGFLRGEPDLQEYFTVVEKDTDISHVFRPRATPLLTPFKTAEGEKLVWTTFGTDQIDLNYSNPEVLINVIDILLFYAAHGAEFIRLDAVTYVWKELGTNCINLPRTHCIVQLMRTILDIAAPGVAIITETNVPHEDNIAYFGDGTNEAQMVYNFALPILTLHAFQTGDVGTLSNWAATLELPSKQATFFNFLAGHDGIGIMPVKDILSPEDLNKVTARVISLGGFVSYKSNEDGSQSAYELNINYLDALRDPQASQSDTVIMAKRFLASQSIMLSMRGVPGIYFHSLFGSHNWTEGVEQTGHHRTINREKLERSQLEKELADSQSLRYHVFNGFRKLLQARISNTAFHPFGEQLILLVHKSVFALLRTSPDGERQVLCLHNVTDKNCEIIIDLVSLPITKTERFIDILSQQQFSVTDQKLKLTIAPYQILWLRT